jgi:hypothetical protein
MHDDMNEPSNGERRLGIVADKNIPVLHRFAQLGTISLLAPDIESPAKELVSFESSKNPNGICERNGHKIISYVLLIK